jgi:hypothetical protein
MQSVDVMLDPFDRSNGNGSRNTEEDWLDRESIYDNEWGSQAATTFKPHDTDGQGNPIPKDKQEKLQRLYERQNGKGDPDRKGEIRASHIENDIETFMSVLEMPSRQRETVREIMDNLDISSNNFGGGRRYEKIIMAVCSLVADEALSNRRDPSVDERLFLSDRYRDLMRATKMSSSDHRKLRVSIREKSEYFDQ